MPVKVFTPFLSAPNMHDYILFFFVYLYATFFFSRCEALSRQGKDPEGLSRGTRGRGRSESRKIGGCTYQF